VRRQRANAVLDQQQESVMTTPFKREVDRLMRMNEEAMDGDEVVGHRDGCVWLRTLSAQKQPTPTETNENETPPNGA
jgi:hypothetical protein